MGVVTIGFYCWGLRTMQIDPESAAAAQAIKIADTLLWPAVLMMAGALSADFIRKQWKG